MESIIYKELDKFKDKHTFGMFEAALATLLFIVFNFFFIFLYGMLPAHIRAIKAVYYIASFLVEAIFGLVAILVAKSRSISIKSEAGANKKISGKLVGLAFLVAIVCLFFLSDLTSAFIDFLLLIGYKPQLSDLTIGSFWQYLIYIVVSCITPAVCEELLFRGVIASGLKGLGKTVAVVLSATIFMLMHGNPEQTIHQFLIGLVIGYIFISTGNLWIGVLIHFFNNFISVTASYALTLMSSMIPDVEAGEVVVSNVNPWLSFVVELAFAVVLALAGYYILKAIIKRMKAESDRINRSESANSTILVDGEVVETVITTSELEEPQGEAEVTQVSEAEEPNPKHEKMSVITIVMFVLSGIYLVLDWLGALLIGLGVL